MARVCVCLCVCGSTLALRLHAVKYRADYRLAPSQCETSVQSNAQLGTNLESALKYVFSADMTYTKLGRQDIIMSTSSVMRSIILWYYIRDDKDTYGYWSRLVIFISKFVPKGQINNCPAMFRIMAWRRPDNKPLSEPMMFNLLTHICITLPQLVNSLAAGRWPVIWNV